MFLEKRVGILKRSRFWVLGFGKNKSQNIFFIP
jgi:hypothetical protein